VTGGARNARVPSSQWIAGLFMIELCCVKWTYVKILSKMLRVTLDATGGFIRVKTFVSRNLCLKVFVTHKTFFFQYFFFSPMTNVAVLNARKFLMRF
jgi:hypothetical protein